MFYNFLLTSKMRTLEIVKTKWEWSEPPRYPSIIWWLQERGRKGTNVRFDWLLTPLVQTDPGAQHVEYPFLDNTRPVRSTSAWDALQTLTPAKPAYCNTTQWEGDRHTRCLLARLQRVNHAKTQWKRGGIHFSGGFDEHTEDFCEEEPPGNGFLGLLLK